jgi:hypothetical protein
MRLMEAIDAEIEARGGWPLLYARVSLLRRLLSFTTLKQWESVNHTRVPPCA